MRDDKNFLSEGVREQVVTKKKHGDNIPEAVLPEVLSAKDRLSETLVPLEVKITKSKDSEKNKSRFFLFCKDNLRIYNNIEEYIRDAPLIKINSDRLDNDVNKLMNYAISNVVTTDFIEPSIISEKDDEQHPFDNDFDDSLFQNETIDNVFH